MPIRALAFGLAVVAKGVLFLAPTLVLAVGLMGPQGPRGPRPGGEGSAPGGPYRKALPVAQVPPTGPGPPLPPMPPLSGTGSVIGSVVMYGLALLYLEIRRARADRRANLAKQMEDLGAENVKLHERLGDHDQAIRANTARSAGVDGKVDGTLKILVEKGILSPALRSPGPHAEPRPTLLIVENDPATVHALAKLFTERGFAVREAGTIPDAIALVDKAPHWVLLDLKLVEPGDGLKVLRHIREQAIPSRVVVLTGAPDGGPVIAECRRLGPEELFFKPMGDLQPLLDSVRSDLPRPEVVPGRGVGAIGEDGHGDGNGPDPDPDPDPPIAPGA